MFVALVRVIAVGALALVCATCGQSHPTAPDVAGTLTPVATTSDWLASSPSAERLDATRLEDLVQRIRRGQYGRITSLLIARNGHLLVEEYFNAWSAGQPHTMQSVTKSVTALLVGLAVQSGRLRVQDRVTQFFPEYAPLANADERKSAITVADLMAMRSGFDWDESVYAGSPLQRMNDCRCDWLRFVLDWRMRDQPGNRWEYISGATIVLGGLVGSATGARLDRFAASALFGPLATTGEYWIHGLPDGLPHAGGGLFLRPRDMAKIGAVVVDNGRWQNRDVLNSEWIGFISTRVSRGVRTWAGRSFDYSYGWWLTDYQGSAIVTAAGAQGQWIFAVPSLRLVMVATANNEGNSFAAPVDFLFSHVLPSATQ